MEQIVSLAPLVLVFAVFYFIVLRPQSKQRKEAEKMRNELSAGDEVITIGGLYGVVYAVDEKNVVLELLPDFNKAMFKRSAIAQIIPKEVENDDDLDEVSDTMQDTEVEDVEVEDIKEEE